VVGCVPGRSAAFMGGWSVRRNGPLVSPERPRTVLNETETETVAIWLSACLWPGGRLREKLFSQSSPSDLGPMTETTSESVRSLRATRRS
jgi:hypothetical protein